MDNKGKMFALVGVSILLIAAMFMFAFTPTEINSKQSELSDGINYKATVCTSVDRVDGTHENVGCSHNLLTNAGKELIETYIGSGGSGAVNYIALCNATAGCAAPAAGDTSLTNEFTSGGLQRAQGTYSTLAGSGNWSIAKTFTATSDNLVTNKTALLNASSAGTLFAENTFVTVTLQTNDQVTINWTISVS